MNGPVVVLAGGTGGAKLARGMLDVVGDDLVVVANTGDDVEVYGAHVSPDPDLCLFWLADRIDERGWGLAGDTFVVMDHLRALGHDVWFNLGDEDLAIGIARRAHLEGDGRLTEALADLARVLGVTARVLPMSDHAVRTRVRAAGRWWDFQEFMIRHQGAGPVEDLAFTGLDQATPPPEVLEAISSARAILIGPSNPVISIRPILSVPGLADALRSARAPVVAVSPIVDGQVLKGPTAAFMDWAGEPLSATGVGRLYSGLIDGMVADEIPNGLGLPALRTSTTMSDAVSRAAVAREALAFTEGLAH